MGEPSRLDRVLKRSSDVALTHHIIKNLRPPFSGQDLIAHPTSRLRGHTIKDLWSKHLWKVAKRTLVPGLANPQRDTNLLSERHFDAHF